MIEYYSQLNDQEKAELTHVIRCLYNQTYLLEKKYDKKYGRYQISSKYRVCERHLDFLTEYFNIGGFTLVENRQLGIMALQSTHLLGDKLTKLTTIFTLLLKLIYDEKMNTASNSIHVYASLEEVYGKIQLFSLWDNRALPVTEVRKAVSVLKKYQVIEVFDTLEELSADTRILIYPTILMVVNGMDIKALIQEYSSREEDGEEEEDGQISGFDQSMSE